MVLGLWLRRKLGVERNEKELENMAGEIQELQELRSEIKELKQNKTDRSETNQLRNRLAELEPEASKFTDREFDVLKVFVDSEGYLSASDVASELSGCSTNNARVIVNDLKEKIELDVRKEGRSKQYRLPDSVVSDLFGGR